MIKDSWKSFWFGAPRSKWGWTAVGLFLALLTPVGFNLVMTNPDRTDTLFSMLGAAFALIGLVTVYLTVRFQPKVMRDTPHSLSHMPPELQLLKALQEVRSAAEELLSDKRSASPIRIRISLHRSGVWSDEDVDNFDSALKVRNTIAHGDLDQLDHATVGDALIKLKNLKKKLDKTSL